MKKIYSLNENWKFKKADEVQSSYRQDYFDSFRSNTKTGLISGPMASSFYDGDFKDVTLPHDWVIEEAPNKDFSPVQGYRPQGAAIYRKHFTLNRENENKHIYLKFDGISISSEIYFNDIKVATSEAGYTPIFIDVTDFVYFDRSNTIAVKTDCSVKEGWWYEGGGIYRNTYLIVKEDCHFENDGVFISAKRKNSDIWEVSVDIDCVKTDDCFFEVQIGNETIKSFSEKFTFEYKNPSLWDDETPNLYDISVKLKNENVVFDEEIIKFGFREFYFDKDNGFVINGKNKKLKGVCLHHDHCGVGVAVDKGILEYRMKKLKEMGCNAIRTSHNPQSPEFYEACDKLGFYIMNETRHFSSSSAVLNELEAFVKRDRNHPCVILWSLFNEEPLQCFPMGEKMIASMIKRLHQFDTTRPITGGMNGPIEINGVVKYVDVMGFNYLQYGYDEFHRLHPDISIIGSETGSYMSSRDEYVSDREKSKVASYTSVLNENLYHWSDTPGGTWKYIMDRPFVAGGFYWTGFDYYGETGPYNWPGITSTFGAMDVCGFEKDCYYWHKALWRDDVVLEVPRMWNGNDGEPLDMVCYSNCDTLEFIVNGTSLGERKNDVFNPEVVTVNYEKGELKVIGRNDGKNVCEKSLFTCGEKRSLELELSNSNVNSGENVICNIYLKDEYGQIVKTSSSDVKIAVNGGKITGSGNGDNANHLYAKSDTQPLFHGSAQFIIRVDDENVTIDAQCESAKCTAGLNGKANNTLPTIKSADYKSYGYDFRISDVHSTYPEKEQIPDNMFTWIPTAINNEKSLMMSGKEGFATLACKVNVPVTNADLYLTAEKIRGDFDICICGEKIYSTDGEYCGDIKVLCNELKNAENPSVQFVFRLSKKDCGISGNVYVC